MKPDFITDLDWQLLRAKYQEQLKEVVEKLNNDYPVQYLIGNVEFLNTVINVDERVLIPRFETELLVEKTINKIKALNIIKPKILELGTGSGCISIALKKNIPCEIDAVDNSAVSLELAQENAQQNNVSINFILSDMAKVSFQNYDVIISNPPYVSIEEKVDNQIKYEPHRAIFAPNHGLYFYELIIKKIAQENPELKLLALEIGINQPEHIQTLVQNSHLNQELLIAKDYTNRPRFAFLMNKKSSKQT